MSSKMLERRVGEIESLVAEGLTREEIAESLGMSYSGLGRK